MNFHLTGRTKAALASSLENSLSTIKASAEQSSFTLTGTGIMGDFLSLAQLGLPVNVVVFNKGALRRLAERRQQGRIHHEGRLPRDPAK